MSVMMPKVLKGPADWQVLQQKNGFAEVKIEGVIENAGKDFCFKNAKILVRTTYQDSGLFANKLLYFKVQEDGTFIAKFNLKVGGPYNIALTVRHSTREESPAYTISNVGVGDIFLISGQSNAVGTSKSVLSDELNPNVRVFALDGKWKVAKHPLSDPTNSKYECFLKGTAHSAWIRMASDLSKVLGYPIGLIPTAVGGVPISKFDKTKDGELFDVMSQMCEESGNGIRAVIWYQGESDVGSKTYQEDFKRLYSQFEKRFFKNIPVFTAQINKQTFIHSPSPAIQVKYWSEMRETQRKLMHEMKNVYMIPTLDLPVGDTIHNSDYANYIIAWRMSMLILGKLYGIAEGYEAPDIIKAKLNAKNSVCLYFNNVMDSINTEACHYSLLPFMAYDEEGNGIALSGYECMGNKTITLTFEKNIKKGYTIGCSAPSMLYTLPYDLMTRLPIMPFENVVIE